MSKLSAVLCLFLLITNSPLMGNPERMAEFLIENNYDQVVVMSGFRSDYEQPEILKFRLAKIYAQHLGPNQRTLFLLSANDIGFAKVALSVAQQQEFAGLIHTALGVRNARPDSLQRGLNGAGLTWSLKGTAASEIARLITNPSLKDIDFSFYLAEGGNESGALAYEAVAWSQFRSKDATGKLKIICDLGFKPKTAGPDLFRFAATEVAAAYKWVAQINPNIAMEAWYHLERPPHIIDSRAPLTEFNQIAFDGDIVRQRFEALSSGHLPYEPTSTVIFSDDTMFHAQLSQGKLEIEYRPGKLYRNFKLQFISDSQGKVLLNHQLHKQNGKIFILVGEDHLPNFVSVFKIEIRLFAGQGRMGGADAYGKIVLEPAAQDALSLFSSMVLFDRISASLRAHEWAKENLLPNSGLGNTNWASKFSANEQIADLSDQIEQALLILNETMVEISQRMIEVGRTIVKSSACQNPFS